MKPYVRKSRRSLIICLALFALLLWAMMGTYLLHIYSFGNFHTVVADELYRSAQLSPKQIKTLNDKYKFKTIINLRGANAGNAWYDDEIAEAEKLGIKHIDFGISAVRKPPPEKITDLITLFKDSEKPILIHCKAGADRAGFASALYLAAVKNEPATIAKRQLSFEYGHFALPFLGEYNMERTFDAITAKGYPQTITDPAGAAP